MKRVIQIRNKEDAGFDAEYWQNKSGTERLQALELLRKQYLIKNGVRPEFQRVFRIVERTPS